MVIQWYPGHMTKAKRQMTEDVKKVDCIIEILDARIPHSSENPDIQTLSKNKYRLVVLNKTDMANDAVTKEWISYFQKQGVLAVSIDGRVKKCEKVLENAVSLVCKELIEKQKKKGFLNPSVKAMVCGIPNVGKSTIINTLLGRASLKTANKPGVTRANQWIRVSPSLSLLDTPGILWPKFDDETVGTHIAFIGSLNDDIVSNQELAEALAKELYVKEPSVLKKRYGEGLTDGEGLLIESLAKVKNLLKNGGEPDLKRASEMIINDFRSGKLGKITLERP